MLDGLTRKALATLGVNPEHATAQLDALAQALATTAANSHAIASSLKAIDTRLSRLEAAVCALQAALCALLPTGSDAPAPVPVPLAGGPAPAPVMESQDG